MQYLLIMADGARTLTFDHCVEALAHLRPARRESLDPVEVAAAVKREGSVSEVARKIGRSRTTVYEYLKCARALATGVEAGCSEQRSACSPPQTRAP